MKYIKNIILTTFVVFSIYTISTQVNAATFTCTESQLSGFASIVSFFGHGDLLRVEDCSQDYIQMTTGSTNEETYTYTAGYYKKTDDTSWTSFEFNCPTTGLIGPWCPSEAHGGILYAEANTNYTVLSYTCEYVTNEWDCGCSNADCTSQNWSGLSIDTTL